MALIECPECGREASSSAAACPACAYPLNTATSIASGRSTEERSELVWWRTGVSVVSRVAVGALLMVAASEIDTAEWGTFIGGLIITASAIPAFVRGHKASLRAKGSGPTAALMEDRMTAIDEHYRERIDQIEQTHAAQLGELEERIDFAERLLTKQREQIGPG